VVLPAVCAAVLDMLRKPDEVLLGQHLSAVLDSALRRAAQLGFEFACLPYEAAFSLDAIVRTLWRMGVSHRSLLEWCPSSEVERKLGARSRDGLVATFIQMGVGPALALGLGLGLAVWAPSALVVAAPVLLLWCVSPALAWWISQPLAARKAVPERRADALLAADGAAHLVLLRHLRRPGRQLAAARQLPGIPRRRAGPPHFAHQHGPGPAGQSGAWDFGYILAGPLMERRQHLATPWTGWTRYRGHFYNWYDTRTLQPCRRFTFPPWTAATWPAIC
jgi:cyclic beta-1,2-glucan synthetase